MAEQFSGVLGIDETELRTVDRALKEGGLRRVGARRFPPDYTLEEGVRLLLGVAGAKHKVDAAKDVADMQEFRLASKNIKTDDGSVDALSKIIGLSVAEMQGMPLVEVLAAVAVHIADHTPGYCGLLIPVGGPVTLQIQGDGFKGRLRFVCAGSHRPSVLTRQARVRTEALRWLGANLGNAK